MRAANASDFEAIRALIHAVKINPTGLDWRRFIVAVDGQDKIIGCGQIKAHRDGSYELASIAVVPEWRGRGVARAIMDRLISSHHGRFYLTCRSGLRPFYEKFGFSVAQRETLTPYFRHLLALVRLVEVTGLVYEGLLGMVREAEEDTQ